MDRIVNESINELRRQFLDQSQVLSTVTELIGEGLQISEESQLLKRAATKLIESHDFEHCCIFIGRQTAQVRADESMQLAVAVSLESLLDPHLIPTVDLTWIASCEQAAKTAAARGNGRVEAHIEESSTDSGTCYAITLQYQGDCMGVIVAVTQKTDASYLRLLSVYASILSSLLLNARQGYRMSRSITEQTKELDAANERAESSDKVKSQFVSNMSHEIKTPMNAIVGLTSLLVDSELANEQKECVNTILTTCDSLLEIIDNVLDFSKIGSGQLQIAQEPLQLRKMADELIQKYAVQARNKGIELQLLLAPEVPHRVVTDPVRLKQVLANLIENGIKFTDTGMVRLDIYCENLSQTEASVRFEVTDTGIGIDDAQMAEIYDDFNQLDNSDTRRHGGTGIGLCIARKLVELLGGEFKSSSIRTAGSRFWFVLILPVRQWQQDNSSQESTDQPDAQAERISPATVRESSAREPSAHEPSKHQTSLSSSRSAQGGRVDQDGINRPPYVLLAEDNAINQKVAACILENSGCKVDIADDGVQALKKHAQADYDLIFMDCQMPNMDGFEATKKIRSCEGAGKSTPIIAVTANDTPADRQKSAAAGMNGFLTKPMTPALLQGALREWLGWEMRRLQA